VSATAHAHRLRRVVTAAALAAFALPAATAGAACRGADSLPGQAVFARSPAATLCLLNRERARAGRAPLRPDAQLARAGMAHAVDMVTHVYFAHNSRDGHPFFSRIRATGYLAGAFDWTLGENLAWGAGRRASPRLTVRAWMHSPGHRRNILDSRYTDIGIAVVPGAPVAARMRARGPAATYATEFGARALR
jgi:uncharacterized protein YkwD